jgi:hypothetical protein
MTDLSKLSYKELEQLQNQIEERKEMLRNSKDCVEGYKITFCVKFNPAFKTRLKNAKRCCVIQRIVLKDIKSHSV